MLPAPLNITLLVSRVVVGHLHADVLWVILGGVDGEDLVARLPRARVPLESLVARVGHQGGAVDGHKRAVVCLVVGVRVAEPASSVASRDLRVRREVNVLTEDRAPRTVMVSEASGLRDAPRRALRLRHAAVKRVLVHRVAGNLAILAIPM